MHGKYYGQEVTCSKNGTEQSTKEKPVSYIWGHKRKGAVKSQIGLKYNEV